MRASDRCLARRYGRALFLAAAGEGLEARVQAELAEAREAIGPCLALLRHPRIPAAEKKAALAGALGGAASALTLRFLELLIDKKRFELLPLVCEDFAKLVAEKAKLATARVAAPRALSLPEQERLKAGLKRFAGVDVELELTRDPGLIGGVVVRLGDWVLDGSLRGRLHDVRGALHGD